MQHSHYSRDAIVERRKLVDGDVIEVLWHLEGSDGVEHELWWPATLHSTADALTLAELEAGGGRRAESSAAAERPAKRSRIAEAAAPPADDDAPRFPVFQLVYRGGISEGYDDPSTARAVLLSTRLLDDLTGGAQCPWRREGEKWDGHDVEAAEERDEAAFVAAVLAARARGESSGFGAGPSAAATPLAAQSSNSAPTDLDAQAVQAATQLTEAMLTALLEKHSERLARLPHTRASAVADEVARVRPLFVEALREGILHAEGGVVDEDVMQSVLARIGAAVSQ